jgi:hypothetical protein
MGTRSSLSFATAKTFLSSFFSEVLFLARVQYPCKGKFNRLAKSLEFWPYMHALDGYSHGTQNRGGKGKFLLGIVLGNMDF